MTYVGFDGSGYQTGLASSADLLTWTKEGCILRRDPSSPITRYNIAMNWVVRQNELRSPGELKKIRGRYLGVYHAYPNAGYEQGAAVIGLCWSSDLRNWQIEPPCLRPEDGADWESGGLYKPCLVEERGTYYLFYNAKTKTRPREQGGAGSSRRASPRHATSNLDAVPGRTRSFAVGPKGQLGRAICELIPASSSTASAGCFF